MAWLQLSVEVDAGAAERISDTLDTLGSAAVTLCAAGVDEVFEPMPGEQPLWDVVRLEALFDMDADLGAIRARLEAAGARVLDVAIIEDADWQESWRAHAVRACFGERLWVLPHDEPLPAAAAADPAAVVLRLDPGLAFGSGAHPTTRLCLGWLARADLQGRRVLDFGCGSGILALAACLLGARDVVAIDHDPQALTATLDNAARNGIGPDRLRVGDLARLGAEGWDAAPFDVVIANILANPLVELAPLLSGLLAPNGSLALSGLLADQEPMIRAAYPAISFAPAIVDEEWILLSNSTR